MNKVTQLNESEARQASRAPVDIAPAYARPTAFLPLDSTLPPPSDRASQISSKCALIQVALLAIESEAAQMNARFTRHVLSNAELNEDFLRLEAFLGRAGGLLAGELPPVEEAPQQLEVSPREISGDPAEHHVADYAIYDAYFQVVRISQMTIPQFAAQVVATCWALLRDLPFAVLGMDQVLALTETIQTMVAYLMGNFDSDEGERLSPAENEVPILETSSWQEFWGAAPCSRQLEDRTCKVAFYRWSVGHHFFNLSSIFCASHLDAASRAIAVADEENAAASILQAAGYLRGVTAAMCYAANFPSEFYRGPIRQSMIVTGAPHGFSGSQNADYHNLKTRKCDLIQRLSNSYGSDTSRWPPAVLAAIATFHELDIQDSEHHILLAAYKVGRDSSLSQKTWHGRLPATARVKNAVDILREMTEFKRRQYQF